MLSINGWEQRKYETAAIPVSAGVDIVADDACLTCRRSAGLRLDGHRRLRIDKSLRPIQPGRPDSGANVNLWQQKQDRRRLKAGLNQ